MDGFDVAVIGAGPAGLASACRLGLAGWRVAVLERAATPRRKLCGEFVSGDGWRVLGDLGVAEGLIAAGCPRIDGLLVSSCSGRRWQVEVAGLGWGCTREQLGAGLEDRCLRSGVVVLRGYRVDLDRLPPFPGPGRLRAHGHAGALELCARLVVLAGGQSASARVCGRHAGGSRGTGAWLAFAARARGGSLPSRVELHALSAGYAGLCRVDGDRVNLCALVRVAALERLRHRADWPTQILKENAFLNRYLDDMPFAWDQLVTTAGVRFGHRPLTDEVLAVGDAAVAPAPLLGQGLAAALRGGQILGDQIDAHLRGALSQAGLVAAYRAAWAGEFGRRFRAGAMLQRALLSPVGAELAVRALSRMPRTGRRLVLATRGRLAAGG